MNKKVKGLVFACLALVLVFSLAGLACAPKAPTGETVPKADLTKAQADLTKAQADLAAEKQKTKDVEAQLAAAQKPAKVYRMEPATWISSGTPFDFLTYMANWLNKNSNGRIEDTPSAVGAVCPVEEQMEAAAAGTTMAMLCTPSYYAGKIPVAALYNTSIGLPSAHDMMIAYEYFQDGAAQKLYFDQIEKNYNVKSVGSRYGEADMIISAKVDISSIAALKGVKFRCGDEHIAVPLNLLGATTTWFPGSEIYTSLATGVVDAFTYGSSYDHFSMGVADVTKYWGPRNHPIVAAINEQFVVNLDVWNEMGEDLHSIISEAIEAANQRSATESYYLMDTSWQKAIAAGIVPVDWSDEDGKLWVETQLEFAKKYTDTVPEDAQFMKIIADYGVFKGF